MGKVSATEMKRRKKTGRPSKNSLSLSTPPKPVNYDTAPGAGRRFNLRNPNNLFDSPPPEFAGDDDDERKEKKVKLVGRLPQSEEGDKIDNQKQQQKKKNNNKRHSGDNDSGSDSGPEHEDREACAKRRKINGGSDGVAAIQEKKVVKVTDTPLHGSPLESGPTALLPDKKLLVYILDRLQKKDTYGVFSEPVDINELPDYFEVIEQPMDFGTVRKKLDDGAYKNLKELEADVFLICSNAMQYNAPNTVYYRQARSIQDLAERDFANLRHEGDNGEPQPKVVRRGRPPSNKNQKKLLETSPADRVGPEPSSGATRPSGEDKAIGSNSYNLRKVPPLNRFRSSGMFVSSYRPRNGENYSEWLADWNDEFPASIKKADMKYGKKQFTVDENRRETYRQFHPPSSANSSSPLSNNSIGDMKRLVPVGLHEPLAYASSLARFAANLGQVAWKVASRKIETALQGGGIQYGPGWVGENGPTPSQPSLSFSTEKQILSSNSDCNSNNKPVMTHSMSDLNSPYNYRPSEGMMVEAVRKLNSQNEAPYMKTPFPVQQKPVYRNGYGGMYMGPPLRNDSSSSHLSVMNHFVQDEAKLRGNWNSLQRGYQVPYGEGEMWGFGKPLAWPAQQQMRSNAFAVGPDLNLRVQAGSPSSSSLQIGSPPQPDLALQL